MPPTDLSSYELVAPRRIVFGWGRRCDVGPLAAELGSRAFLVLGSRTLERSGIVSELSQSLSRHGVELVELVTITEEPTVADVDSATARLRGAGRRPWRLRLDQRGRLSQFDHGSYWKECIRNTKK